MDEQVLYAEASDDRFTNGIDDLAHNFYFVYEASLNKIPVPVSALIFLSVFVVALSMLSEVRSVTTLFLAHVDTAEALALPRCAGGASRSVFSTVFWTLSHLIHLLRMGLICSFIVSSSFLIGCSDGPAQILLNSVAMLFILDVDDLLAKALDAPWKSQSFFQPESREREAMVREQFGRIAARVVRLRLGRFLHGASAIYLFSVMGLVLWGALLMQKDLSHGDNNIRPAIPVMGADPPRVSGSGMKLSRPPPFPPSGDGVDLPRRVPAAHRGRRRALPHEPAARGPARALGRQGGRVHRVRARDDARLRVVAPRQLLDLVRRARVEGARQLERARVLRSGPSSCEEGALGCECKGALHYCCVVGSDRAAYSSVAHVHIPPRAHREWCVARLGGGGGALTARDALIRCSQRSRSSLTIAACS